MYIVILILIQTLTFVICRTPAIYHFYMILNLIYTKAIKDLTPEQNRSSKKTRGVPQVQCSADELQEEEPATKTDLK